MDRRSYLKIVACFLLVVCLLSCLYGCGMNLWRVAKSYDFLHDTSDIVSIEVVFVASFPEEAKEPIMTKMSQIEDQESFLKDFSKLPCYLKGTPPKIFPDQSFAVLLLYGNGDYELVHNQAQIKIWNHLESVDAYGNRWFDSEEFWGLVKKYAPSCPIEEFSAPYTTSSS